MPEHREHAALLRRRPRASVRHSARRGGDEREHHQDAVDDERRAADAGEATRSACIADIDAVERGRASANRRPVERRERSSSSRVDAAAALRPRRFAPAWQGPPAGTGAGGRGRGIRNTVQVRVKRDRLHRSTGIAADAGALRDPPAPRRQFACGDPGLLGLQLGLRVAASCRRFWPWPERVARGFASLFEALALPKACRPAWLRLAVDAGSAAAWRR